MSKLLSGFDLHYDLKSTEGLEDFIEQAVNPREFMLLMLDEIRSRDKVIKELRGKLLVMSSVERIRNEPSHRHVSKQTHPSLVDNCSDMNILPEGKPVTGAVFTDAPASFCRHCGAGIPHRPGEGRCHLCIGHFDEDVPELPEPEYRHD